MTKRTQTTFTFCSEESALWFHHWLKTVEHDSDFGVPLFVERRQVGATNWCVEYICDNKHADFIRGVATGLNLNYRKNHAR